MAEKRMFTKKITESDAFLDMPLSTQCLYFHLNMAADDDGFVNNPKKIQRMVGASEDDLKLLLAKSFILSFESGVIVIKHWKMHNYIQSDRYKPTDYIEEKSMLSLKENKSYTLNGSDLYTECVQVGHVDKNRLDKNSIDKVRLDNIPSDKPSVKKETQKEMLIRLCDEKFVNDDIKSYLTEWIIYKQQRKDKPYVERGMKSLIKKAVDVAISFNEPALEYAINESMANNYQGIVWDFAKKFNYDKATNNIPQNTFDEWRNA